MKTSLLAIVVLGIISITCVGCTPDNEKGRYQILNAPLTNSSGGVESTIVRIDTVTGQTWTLLKVGNEYTWAKTTDSSAGH